jgi:hypothetical protein
MGSPVAGKFSNGYWQSFAKCRGFAVLFCQRIKKTSEPLEGCQHSPAIGQRDTLFSCSEVLYNTSKCSEELYKKSVILRKQITKLKTFRGFFRGFKSYLILRYRTLERQYG